MQAREDASLKRKDLARLSGIHVSRIVTLEAGLIDQTDFGDDELTRLADVLAKPLTWLITGETPTRVPVSQGVIAERSARHVVQLPLGLDSSLCPRCHEPVSGVRCDKCGFSSSD